MISFTDFQREDGLPVYLQIIRYIKRGVASGLIKNGDELPSRRVLSALLGVNPNTVQKAYRMLEEAGLLQSHSGAKSYMQLDAGLIEQVRAELLESELGSLVSDMRQMGLDKHEVMAMIDKLWEE